jgi:hypothetical protein
VSAEWTGNLSTAGVCPDTYACVELSIASRRTIGDTPENPTRSNVGFFSLTRYWMSSERDRLFRDPGRPRGLDRDPDNVLGRMQCFDDQDAAGLRMSRHHCSVFRRGLATAAFMQRPRVLVVRAHSWH